MDLSYYEQAKPALWQGRTDTENPERFFQKIILLDSLDELARHKASKVFLGFATDVGVHRNAGRVGARFGPDAIKTSLAKLPCHQEGSYIDIGNVLCPDDCLNAAQQQCAELIDYCQQQGHTTIVLGGGHEIAWGHYQGLAPHYPKLGIINFDAHFDLRPYTPGQLGTSGTPFSQIAAYCSEQKQPFNYCCIGIQEFANTPSLFARAHELKVNYLTAEQLSLHSLAWQSAFLDDFMLNIDSIYLSICLDVFAECFAPGVSAPQPLGITPMQALPLLKYIMQSGKVVSFDIAELSPPLDTDKKTARLAALLIAELLNTN